jgi:hypothetical protein
MAVLADDDVIVHGNAERLGAAGVGSLLGRLCNKPLCGLSQ